MTYVINRNQLAVTIFQNMEYASVYLTEVATDNTHSLNLTINSSFGTVSHYWSNMGCLAGQFLPKLERDYLLNKLWGLDYLQFDAKATKEALRELFRKLHADGEMEAEDLDQILTDINQDLSDDAGEIQFRMELEDTGVFSWIGHGEHPMCTKPNPQALGFWRELWPGLLEAVKELSDNGTKPLC